MLRIFGFALAITVSVSAYATSAKLENGYVVLTKKAAAQMKNLAPTPKRMLQLQNTFNTFDELFSELQSMGALTSEARTSIEAFLVKNGIDSHSALPKGVMWDQTIAWHSVRLLALPDGSFQTSSGRVLRVKKSESLDQTFERVFTALKSEDISASDISSWIPQAYAENAASSDAAAASSLVVVNKSFGTAFGALGYLWCRTFILPVDYALYRIRSASAKPHVACLKFKGHEQYVIDEVEPLSQLRAEDTQLAAKYVINSNVTYFKSLNESLITCALADQRLKEKRGITSSNFLSPRTQPAKEFLNAAFHGDLPTCTAKTAKQLGDYIQKAGTKAEKDLIAALAGSKVEVTETPSHNAR